MTLLSTVLKQHRRLNAHAVSRRWTAIKKVLSLRDVDHLAMVGFVSLLNDFRHRERQIDIPGESHDYTIVTVENGGPTDTLVIFAEEIAYEVADGEIKPVAYFTADDCRYAASHMRREAAGMVVRAAWLENVARVLSRRKKAMVKDLPIVVQVELAKRFSRLDEEAA